MLLRFLLYFLVLLFLVVSEIAYKPPMYEYTLYAIKKMQESESMFAFYSVVTMFGNEALVFLVVGVFVSFPRKNVLFIFNVFAIMSYLVSVLKCAYKDPRPFWVDNQIKSTCHLGFGNPSGHSMGTATLYTLIYLSIFYDKDRKYELLSLTKKIIFYASTLLLLIILYIIPRSRMEVGAHSLD